MMNIGQIVKKSITELKKSGIKTPEIDAQVLLEKALDKDRIFLLSNPQQPLTNAEYNRFRSYIRKRKQGVPIAYIIGSKEFYGYDFLVNKATLIPRPESEELISIALKKIQKIKEEKIKKSLKILDLGTGSGCLIISLVKEIFKNNDNIKYDFFASDISKKALTIAKKNAKNILEDNYLNTNHKKIITFLNSDLFSNRLLNKKFDIILANLPYVPKLIINNQLTIDKSITHEPQSAIFADDNGVSIIKKFLLDSKTHVQKDALILIELDHRNAQDIYNYAKEIMPNAKIQLLKDLAKLNRYLEIKIEK